MSKQKSDLYSILLDFCIALLRFGGGLLLVHIIGFIVLYPLFVAPLFFSFGFKDKQVEILVGTSTSWLINVKQTEAKQYVASMNKGQQAYFAENSKFGNSISDLGLGLRTETNNYKYSIRVTQTASFHYALAKDKTLKDYVGGVFLVAAKDLAPNADRDEMTTITIFCQAEKRPLFRIKQADELDEPAEPTYQNGCGKGTTDAAR